MKDNHRELFQNALAVGIMAVCFGYFFWISSNPKATNNQHIGDIKILCVSAVTLVLQFFFGSSKGGQKNAETLRNLVNPQDGTTTMKTVSPTNQPGQTTEQKLTVLEEIENPTVEQLAEMQTLREEILKQHS